jgi:predicted N-formylglutamate amidohydrolase
MKVIITCEHGGKQIPKHYRYLFYHAADLLSSHKGWDIGALQIAKRIASLSDYFFYSEISRLLVELNRSLHHPKLFSTFTKSLSKEQKALLLARYYFPYRNKIADAIADEISRSNKVLHLSIHSFAPVINQKERHVDIGLLFDTQRMLEKSFCSQWKVTMLAINHRLKVRFNNPYLGKADGLITFLRRQFKVDDYLGIELEVNQKYLQDSRSLKKMQSVVYDSLKDMPLY